MSKIIAFSGSLRQGSYNTALLKAAIKLAPKNLEIELISIAEIPLYNGDVEEKEGVPQVVEEIKDKIAKSDGLLVSTPEYNNSIPGVVKNAVDWLTRPPKDIAKVFGDKKIAIMGASPGGFGTILAQTAWLSVFRTLGMRPYFKKSLLASKAHTLFDDKGNLIDQVTQQKLNEFMQGFAQYIEE